MNIFKNTHKPSDGLGAEYFHLTENLHLFETKNRKSRNYMSRFCDRINIISHFGANKSTILR